MRYYFKNDKKPRVSKLFKFAEAHNADYFENNEAIWVKPKKSKGAENRIAINFDENGDCNIGIINEDCLNFERTSGDNKPESQKWIIEILTMLQKFHK